jgi:hypothetical protein
MAMENRAAALTSRLSTLEILDKREDRRLLPPAPEEANDRQGDAATREDDWPRD